MFVWNTPGMNMEPTWATWILPGVLHFTWNGVEFHGTSSEYVEPMWIPCGQVGECKLLGIGRRSAVPMAIEDLVQIIQWSELKSPSQHFNQLAADEVETECLAMKHVMMRAYMTSVTSI